MRRMRSFRRRKRLDDLKDLFIGLGLLIGGYYLINLVWIGYSIFFMYLGTIVAIVGAYFIKEAAK